MKAFKVFLVAVSLVGCAAQPVGTPSQLAQSPSQPVVTTLAKVSQPAFAADFSGRTVAFDASYIQMLNTMIDLPRAYQQNYIRLVLCSSSSAMNLGGQVTQSCSGGTFKDFLVPKHLADAVLNLESGARISIVAEAVAAESRSIAGGRGGTLVLIAKSISLAK